MEDVNKRRRISFSLSKVECAPQEINSREIRLHLPFSTKWNKHDSVWKTGIHFKSDVYTAVAVVDAKAPYCIVATATYLTRKHLFRFSFLENWLAACREKTSFPNQRMIFSNCSSWGRTWKVNHLFSWSPGNPNEVSENEGCFSK